MVEHLIKLTCSNCGHSITYNPEDTEVIYGWTDDYCPKCVRFKGKRPKNLSKEELRKALFIFTSDLPRRII